MKIAILNVYQGSVSRGLESFISDFTTGLTKKGHIVEVITGKQPNRARWPFLWRFYIDPHGAQVLLFTLKSLSQIIKGEFDLVIPSNGGYQSFLIRLLSIFFKFKVVIIGHSGIGWDDKVNIWTRPHLFVALSKTQEAWSKKISSFSKVLFIPNGVDLNIFKSAKPSRSIKHRILTVGALVPSKRINLTIDAVAAIPDAYLTIVGSGEDERKLTALCDEIMPGRFEFKKVKHSDMQSVYVKSDVFTLVPYSHEAFGIVFLEALASNLPVVTINDSVRREIVGAAGYFVDPTNTKQYSEALTSALSKSWGDAPRKQAEKYSWDKIINLYEDAFINICKK